MAAVIMEEQDMPKFRDKVMSIHTFEIVFASYHWFEADGRRLRRDEVVGIACICDGGGEPPVHTRWLWEKLVKPKQKTKIILDDLTIEQKSDLTSQVGPLFQKLLEDPVFKARHDDLQGFKGRFTSLPSGNINRPVLNQQPLRDEQIYLIYAIANWCADSAGNKITPRDGSRIISRYYDWRAVKGGFPFLQRLADPNHNLTKLVAGVIMEANHETFFKGKALDLYMKYATEGMVKASTPPPVTGTTSEPSTAESPSPHQFDVDDFVVDYDDWQGIQATEAPCGASGSNLLDKGKTRQRNS